MGCEIGFGALLNQVGCEERKIPAEGVIFFLDFYPFPRPKALVSCSIPQ